MMVMTNELMAKIEEVRGMIDDDHSITYGRLLPTEREIIGWYLTKDATSADEVITALVDGVSQLPMADVHGITSCFSAYEVILARVIASRG